MFSIVLCMFFCFVLFVYFLPMLYVCRMELGISFYIFDGEVAVLVASFFWYLFSVCRTGGWISMWDQRWSFQLSSWPWSCISTILRFASGWSASLLCRQNLHGMLRQNLRWTTQWWMWWERIQWWICRNGIALAEIYYIFSAVIEKNDVFPLAIVGDAGDVPKGLKCSPTMTAVSDHKGEMERYFPEKKYQSAFQLSSVCWTLYCIVLIIGEVT